MEKEGGLKINKISVSDSHMIKIKDLIEKIWWMIPPVVVVFVFMPLEAYFEVRRHYLGHFNGWDVVNYWISTFLYCTSELFAMILIVFTFGFMSFGYYLIRRKSLALRISIPILLAILGFYTGAVVILSLTY